MSKRKLDSLYDTPGTSDPYDTDVEGGRSRPQLYTNPEGEPFVNLGDSESNEWYNRMNPEEEQRMDTEERALVEQSGNRAGMKRKADGADLLAPAHRRFLQGQLHKFVQRYCLVMYTFGQSAKLIDTGTAYLASPLYVFNPAHLGQYVTPAQLTWINTLKTGGFNAFVRNIKGCLKFAGINAPFVTETTTQNATNSQLTAVGMRGSGLERIAPVYQGTADIAETTAVLNNWTVHGQNEGFDWQANSNSSGTFTTTAWSSATRNADRNFIEYTTTGCVKTNASATTLSNIAQIGKCMQAIDLTSSQGPLVEWDHDMHDCAVAVNPYNGNLGLVANAKASIAPDVLIALPSAAGTNAISANGADSSIGDPTANMYLSHYNVYKIGATESRHQELPPKEYLQLVPAPTINPDNTQDFYVMGVLDVEMSIEIERDGLFTSGGTRADKTMYVKKSKFLGDSQVHAHGNPATAV